MSSPRYSIIPAGAVTDRRLEGRDLQVLCFLGRHTDKLGWCFLSQVGMAAELDCGRATVQRSLGRLYAAGWVEMRPAAERPHACHAYRVIMDRDDPELGPSEYEVEDQKRDHGCPPVGTVPALHGQGGARAYMGTERPQVNDLEGGDARAREPLVTIEATILTEEIATIAGYPDPKAWPIGWCGAPMRMQAFLTHGWLPDVMRATAHSVMTHKRDGPPESLNYFAKPFARAHDIQKSPLPSISAGGLSNEPPAKRRGITAAIDRHIERFEREERAQDGSGEVRQVAPRLLSHG